jgi:hypothetical protein
MPLPGLSRVLRGILAASCASACFLTFVWPFAVSADPADAAFRTLAIGTFLVLLASIATLAFLRLRRAA